MGVTEEEARRMLDELAEELVARGFIESLHFGVAGRRARRVVSSALTCIGFENGRFVAWYRESGDRAVLAESEDLAPVRAELVRVVEKEARTQRPDPWPFEPEEPAEWG